MALAVIIDGLLTAAEAERRRQQGPAPRNRTLPAERVRPAVTKDEVERWLRHNSTEVKEGRAVET